MITLYVSSGDLDIIINRTGKYSGEQEGNFKIKMCFIMRKLICIVLGNLISNSRKIIQ